MPYVKLTVPEICKCLNVGLDYRGAFKLILARRLISSVKIDRGGSESGDANEVDIMIPTYKVISIL